jgi:hypothetical protein
MSFTASMLTRRVFAASNAGRPTTCGRYDWFATSKKTVPTPVSRATTYSWPIVSASSHHAVGTDSSTAARARSAVISTPRRRTRSVHAPAGRPMTRNATVFSVASRPTSPGDASSAVTAISGIAT